MRIGLSAFDAVENVPECLAGNIGARRAIKPARAWRDGNRIWLKSRVTATTIAVPYHYPMRDRPFAGPRQPTANPEIPERIELDFVRIETGLRALDRAVLDVKWNRPRLLVGPLPECGKIVRAFRRRNRQQLRLVVAIAGVKGKGMLNHG